MLLSSLLISLIFFLDRYQCISATAPGFPRFGFDSFSRFPPLSSFLSSSSSPPGVEALARLTEELDAALFDSVILPLFLLHRRRLRQTLPPFIYDPLESR